MTEWRLDKNALHERVAVVAGATRGAGRGIAAALGEAGATVVCTGRSTRWARSEYNRAETIEDTAQLVTDLGGTGIAVAVDHLETDQVRRLADRIRTDHGHIDVLVNDIWGGELLKGGPSEWNKTNLGAQPRERISDTSPRDRHSPHHIASSAAAAHRPAGRTAGQVTDWTLDYNAAHYRISVFYDLAKVAVNRLAFAQGHELEPHGATAVAITPGWLRSEMMLDNFGVSEENWRDAILGNVPGFAAARPEFALSESPRYVGRAIVALAIDPQRTRWNQKSVTSGQLASGYGFADVDGSRPDIWRFMDMRERGLEADMKEYR